MGHIINFSVSFAVHDRQGTFIDNCGLFLAAAVICDRKSIEVNGYFFFRRDRDVFRYILIQHDPADPSVNGSLDRIIRCPLDCTGISCITVSCCGCSCQANAECHCRQTPYQAISLSHFFLSCLSSFTFSPVI